MSLSEYYCGLCLSSYAVPTGCDVCEPAKSRIQTAGTNARLDPIEGVNQSLRILRGLLDNAELELATTPTSHKLGMVKELTKLTEAYSKLVEAKRKYEKDQGEVLGFEGEVRTFLGWIDELPPAQRQLMVSRVVGLLPPAPAEITDAEIVEEDDDDARPQ